jgi:hemerythrin-like domain-containing protein
MAMVHSVFRNELRSAPALINSVQRGQRRRVKLVAAHIANVMAALHHHHTAEDERLWPTLHPRVPLHADDLRRMETEHEFIAKSMVSVELRLADWIAATGSTNTKLAAQSQTADTLVDEIKALAALVSDHLSAEEELIVPLIKKNITDAEWRAITNRGGSFFNRNIRFVIAFVGMALESCNADERRRFLAGMPQPQRLLGRLFGRRAAASYRARLERTH